MQEIVIEIRRRKKLLEEKKRLKKAGEEWEDVTEIHSILDGIFSVLWEKGSVANCPFLQKMKLPTCHCTKWLTDHSGLHKTDGIWRQKNKVGEDLADGLEKGKCTCPS